MMLLEDIAPQVLTKIKPLQKGRGADNAPNGTFKWGKVSQYQMLLENIATDILNKSKRLQKGRVAEDATIVAFNFTEGWFRSIYR